MSKRHAHKQPIEEPGAGSHEADVDAGDVRGSGAEDQLQTAPVADPEAELRREVAEWKDKYLRALAEQQNAMRRAANERDDSIRFANAGLLRSLLEVVDDFDRAMDAAQQAETAAGVVDGVKLVQEKLAKFLRDQNVEPIEAQGAMFDPGQHEALLQQPSAEHAAGTVIQQVQRGYRLRDRVLRPAKVIVAAGPAGE